MIPISYPDSSWYRIGEPHVTTIGTRKHRSTITGKVYERCRRQSVVPVRCVCGNEREIELKAWLRCPPMRCIQCHGEARRKGAA